MLWQLLSDAMSAAPTGGTKIDEVHHMVVERMPWGGFSLMLVLVGLTLVVGLWIAWGQRTLANNQVKIAALLETTKRHLADHGKK